MKKIPVEESFFVGALLALSGGLVDVYTYLIRGGVFAFAQTGNLVLLGIRLARGQLGECVHYLIPILAFTVGVILTEGIQQIFKNHPVLLWQQAALLTEILILAAVAFFPIEKVTDNMANIAVPLPAAFRWRAFGKWPGRLMPPPCVPEICAVRRKRSSAFLLRKTRKSAGSACGFTG